MNNTIHTPEMPSNKREETAKVENLIYEIEKLREANEIKKNWLSLLNHDFKEIFSSLAWLLEAVENKSISQDDFFNLLPRIKQDAKKNLQTVLNTSHWLRTQTPEFEPEYQNLALHGLIEELALKLSAKISGKDIHLSKQVSPQLNVYTDRALLQYILEAILENAVKYSHPQQTVAIEAKQVYEGVAIKITDTGIGMAPEQLEELFTFDSPVYKGTHGEIGSGLGLKIAKNFVHLIDGKLNIQSQEDKGTEVTIFLPQN